MEFFIQAGLYVLGYLLTNAAVLIALFHYIVTKRRVGLAIQSISVATFPLGGLFNILIYTRPNVILFRKQHPRCSRMRALILVIKSGDVVPMVPVENENEDLSFGSQEWTGFRSMRTPEVDLGNAVSSGINDNGHDENDQETDRQYYGEIAEAALKIQGGRNSYEIDEDSRNELPQSQEEQHQHRTSFLLLSEMDTIEEEEEN